MEYKRNEGLLVNEKRDEKTESKEKRKHSEENKPIGRCLREGTNR